MDLHFLQETPLFQGLTEQEIQAILPCLGARETPFGKGETLCRAEEILELVDKTEQELVQHPVILEGTVSICCGDLGGVEVLPELIRSFREKHPLVRFELYTATAEHVKERMDRGVTDVGLLLEPVNIEKYEAIPIKIPEEWVAALPPDSPLEEKEALTPEDLQKVPLILPQRMTAESRLARWFGDVYGHLQVVATSNLPSTSLLMVYHRLACALIIRGSVVLWDAQKVTYRPLSPPLRTVSALVWKRGQPFSPAVEAFLQHVRDTLSPL